MKAEAFAKATCEGMRAAVVNGGMRSMLDVSDSEIAEGHTHNVTFMFTCAILVMFMQYGFAAVCAPLPELSSSFKHSWKFWSLYSEKSCMTSVNF